MGLRGADAGGRGCAFATGFMDCGGRTLGDKGLAASNVVGTLNTRLKLIQALIVMKVCLNNEMGVLGANIESCA